MQRLRFFICHTPAGEGWGEDAARAVELHRGGRGAAGIGVSYGEDGDTLRLRIGGNGGLELLRVLTDAHVFELHTGALLINLAFYFIALKGLKDRELQDH